MFWRDGLEGCLGGMYCASPAASKCEPEKRKRERQSRRIMKVLYTLTMMSIESDTTIRLEGITVSGVDEAILRNNRPDIRKLTR